LLVRVMQGDAEVVRKGQLGILKMGLAKKLEGNPAHPINQGKLCPRGQAGLQVTYHPDRVKGPMVRSGARGSGQFKQISWDDAMKQLVGQLSALRNAKQENGLAFVTSPLRGQRKTIVDGFAAGFKSPAPAEFGFLDNAVTREANLRSFGVASLPTVDLGQSNYVISFGADFLGTWNSPVAQAIGYGRMRNGRAGQRGKLVQVEPRMSQTGANADEWIPSAGGSEGIFALSLANVMIQEKLRPAAAAAGAGDAIPGWSQGLADYAPAKVEKQVGVAAATIARIAREAAANAPAAALIGDAAAAQSNGLFNALAVNALNALLGSVGKPGGILFSSRETARPGGLATGARGSAPENSLLSVVNRIHSAPDAVKLLLVYGANPVFATPAAWGVRDAFEKIPFIASFGSFIDETSALADLILPDHSPLESWLDDAPTSGSTRMIVSVAEPAMHPIHDTRAMPDVLLDVAHQLGGDFDKALPWKTYEEAIQAEFAALYKEKGAKSAKDADEFWKKARKQGGWWSAEETATPIGTGKTGGGPVKVTAAAFDGDANDFPFHFLPFASQLFYDGSLAHLPWMQEAPDPLSTVMWGTWVEINPKTAEKLAIRQGDLLEVASQHGKLRAPALVTPGIAPDVVAMPVGQGHENFTRYATGRGANPISILAPTQVAETSSLAWAATRVKVSAVGHGKLVLFGGSLTEAPAQPR
jgi:anaerobic selenocysteine-containing dehydrogenase